MRTETPAQHGEAVLLKNILANVSLYRTLDAGQLGRIVDASQPLRTFGNSQLVKRGDPPKGVYVVIYGQVKIYFANKNGVEKTMAILGQDSYFGLAETILGRPHLACVETISDAMIMHTPRETVLELAKENFQFTERLAACAAQQAYCLVRDVERQAVHTAPQRLAGFLLRQSKYQSSETVQLNASKTLIASRLGIAVETFSRVLKGFTSDGLIEVHGRQIRILDRRKMGRLLFG